jgi:hypothetical protein
MSESGTGHEPIAKYSFFLPSVSYAVTLVGPVLIVDYDMVRIGKDRVVCFLVLIAI